MGSKLKRKEKVTISPTHGRMGEEKWPHLALVDEDIKSTAETVQ